MDRLIGDWYVIARSESVFDETGQCTVKSIDKKNMDSTLTLKTKEQKVDIDFNTIVNSKPQKSHKRIFSLISGIAASLVLALSLTFILKTNNPPVVYAYINGKPITNKQVAMQYSKEALTNISTQFNKGTRGLKYINKINKPVELLTVKK